MKKQQILWSLVVFLTIALVVVGTYKVGEVTNGFTSQPVPDSFSDGEVHTFENEDELVTFLQSQQTTSANSFNQRIAVDTVQEASVADSAAPTGASSNSFSETNVQVQGIDEGDLLKTDGEYIYTITDNTLFIVKATPGEETEVVSKEQFDENPYGLLLVDDLLVVYGSLNWDVARSIAPNMQISFVKVYDISDKEEITLEQEFSFEGYIQTTREKDGEVYIISHASANLDDDYPTPIIMREGELSSIPPSDIRFIGYPYNPTRFTTIHKIEVDSFDIDQTTLLTENSGVLYMSHNNIYLTSNVHVNEWDITKEVLKEVMTPYLDEEDLDKMSRIEGIDYDILSQAQKNQMIQQIYESKVYTLSESERKDTEQEVEEKVKAKLAEYDYFTTTVVQRIGIDSLEVESKGEVPGRLNNQFAMDEFENVLRVATTIDARWSSVSDERSESENHIYTLDEDMQILDEVTGLAKDESIYATRFVGEKLYVVTFRQIDPFFVIDLANPNDIEVLGELKIPGFSRYLHPYDENTIIGIGQDADEDTGRAMGLKISLFDVSDVTNPQEVASFITDEKYARSEALYEHKAFLFDREKNLLVIPAYSPNYYWDEEADSDTYNGAFVFNISKESVTLRGLIDHGNTQDTGYYWQPQVQRSLYIGENLYTKSPYLLRVNALSDLESISNVTLTAKKELPEDIVVY